MSSTESPSTELSSAVQAQQAVVATGDGLQSSGGSDSWLAGHRMTAVSVDGDALWAISDRKDLVRVGADGVEPIARLDEPLATCVHVHRGTVYVGGRNARLWRLRDGELQPVTSFQDAPTRPEWTTPWGDPASVFSMASHGDDLYVSVHVGGILHSRDDGETWTDTIDLHEDVHQVAVDPGTGTVWAATGRRGLAESTDQGRTWRHHVDGLHATYLLAVAVTSAGVIVGASSGHAVGDGGVYLFDGSVFRRPEGLPESLGGSVEPRHIAGAGDDAALVTPDGHLHTSDDGGRTWGLAGGPFASPAEVVVRTPAGGRS